MPFIKIDGGTIVDALRDNTRQYLAGFLSKPQTIAYVEDRAIEIGISSYKKATTEPAHRHGTAREYQLVLKGMTEYRDLATDEIHRFVAGDFYAIYPGTPYAQKIKAGTDILFVKVPGGNDKELVTEDAKVRQWLGEQLRVQRIDLKKTDGTPKANSLKPAVAVGISDKSARILLVQRRDSKNWTMPGGILELDESISQCGCREAQEETGLAICITGLVGSYTDPGTLIAYSDGEVRREFSILLAADIQGGELRTDDESIAIGWFRFDEIQKLPLADSQRQRIHDFFEYCKTGKSVCK